MCLIFSLGEVRILIISPRKTAALKNLWFRLFFLCLYFSRFRKSNYIKGAPFSSGSPYMFGGSQGRNQLVQSGDKIIVTYCCTPQLNMFWKFRGCDCPILPSWLRGWGMSPQTASWIGHCVWLLLIFSTFCVVWLVFFQHGKNGQFFQLFKQFTTQSLTILKKHRWLHCTLTLPATKLWSSLNFLRIFHCNTSTSPHLVAADQKSTGHLAKKVSDKGGEITKDYARLSVPKWQLFHNFCFGQMQFAKTVLVSTLCGVASAKLYHMPHGFNRLPLLREPNKGTTLEIHLSEILCSRRLLDQNVAFFVKWMSINQYGNIIVFKAFSELRYLHQKARNSFYTWYRQSKNNSMT